MKYFILQTPGEIRLLSASNAFDGKLSLQMKGFRTKSGILETWAKDEKMPVGFLERLLKQGYISITEFEYARYLKTSATLLSNEGKEPEGEVYTIVSWAAVVMQFSPGFFNDPNEYLESPELRNFCVYAGDTE